MNTTAAIEVMAESFLAASLSANESARIERAVAYMNEDPVFFIPSVQLGQDGVFLESVFIITKNFLCEARIASKVEEFDLVLKESVFNYRVRFLSVAVGAGDAAKHFEGAQVELKHSTEDFRSILVYVGERWSEWLSLVREALPPQRVLRVGP